MQSFARVMVPHGIWAETLDPQPVLCLFHGAIPPGWRTLR